MHNHDTMDDRIALAKVAFHSAQKPILKYLAKLKVYSATHRNCFKVTCFRREVKLPIAPTDCHLIGNDCCVVYNKATLLQWFMWNIVEGNLFLHKLSNIERDEDSFKMESPVQ